MVISKINKRITYDESANINKDDKKGNCIQYEMEMFHKPVIIAVGNANTQHLKDNNVVFFYIYLINSESNNAVQIGLYELLITHATANTNATNKYESELTNKIESKSISPLLYSFARNEINKAKPLSIVADATVAATAATEAVSHYTPNTSIFTVTPNIIHMLIEENRETALQKHIIEGKTPKNWICSFMNNNLYFVTDNEGGGDCFFSTIRDAFSSIGMQTTVHKLRKLLADNSVASDFENYKEYYDMYFTSITNDTLKIKKIEAAYTLTKDRFTNETNRADQMQLLQIANNIKADHIKMKAERDMTISLFNDVKFMKNVKTLEQFKSKIKQSEYWADEWAIQLLEKLLNIKCIILSSGAFKANDKMNVLRCTPSLIGSPQLYVIMEHTGSHYMLIGYETKTIFTFTELPFELKLAIVDICVSSGSFLNIMEFDKFKEKHCKYTFAKSPDINYLEYVTHSKLYNNEVILILTIYDGLLIYPGNQIGEKMPLFRQKEYAKLASYTPSWRKQLSDEYPSVFNLEGKNWQSVIHYYQAAKYKNSNKSIYDSYSLDSGTELSKKIIDINDTVAATTAAATVAPTATVDADFFKDRNKVELYNAQQAKFNQNKDLQEILLATNDALLMHYRKSKPPIMSNNLMRIRMSLIGAKK